MTYFLSSSPEKLSIEVPRRFSPFLFAFFPLWAAGWITLAVKGYKTGIHQSATIAWVFASVGFGIGTLLFLYDWLWNLGGREELDFTTTTLQYRRVLFGASRSREFRMDQIAEPHFVRSEQRRRSRIPSGLGFKYRGREVRLGDNLNQREAREIVARVIQQFPQLAASWGQYSEGSPEADELISLRIR
jgi:hypothetical protein